MFPSEEADGGLWSSPTLGKGLLCVGEWGEDTFLCQARSQVSIRKRSHTHVGLTSPLYSQWDSAAAPCAPGRLVPRIQQQPAELPATGRPPNPEPAPAPVLPASPVLFSTWISSSTKTSTPAPPRHLRFTVIMGGS